MRKSNILLAAGLTLLSVGLLTACSGGGNPQSSKKSTAMSLRLIQRLWDYIQSAKVSTHELTTTRCRWPTGKWQIWKLSSVYRRRLDSLSRWSRLYPISCAKMPSGIPLMVKNTQMLQLGLCGRYRYAADIKSDALPLSKIPSGTEWICSWYQQRPFQLLESRHWTIIRFNIHSTNLKPTGTLN